MSLSKTDDGNDVSVEHKGLRMRTSNAEPLFSECVSPGSNFQGCEYRFGGLQNVEKCLPVKAF